MKRAVLVFAVACVVAAGLSIPASSQDLQQKAQSAVPPMPLTHTVIAEFMSLTTCPYCRYGHTALGNIVDEGALDFYYISYVLNRNNNTSSNARANAYNVYHVPNVFFDGGYRVELGAGGVAQAQAAYETHINACGARSVPDLDLIVEVNWLGSAQLDVDVSITNNDASPYTGRLRVFVTETMSSMGWNTTVGTPYTYTFLDYAFDLPVLINAGSTWQDSVVWDGYLYGPGGGGNFGSIQEDNVSVIAAVFNPTGHATQSEPGYPFTAYYVDEAALGGPPQNYAPAKPGAPVGPLDTFTGKSNDYTVSTTDPEGDDVYYNFYWESGDSTTWLGPYTSGASVVGSHTWMQAGTYYVFVRAKDTSDHISDWSDLIQVNVDPFGRIFEFGPAARQ